MSTSAANCSTTSTCTAAKTNSGAAPSPAENPHLPPAPSPRPSFFGKARAFSCYGRRFPTRPMQPREADAAHRQKFARFSAHWGKFLRLCRTCFRFALKIRRIMSRFVAYLSFLIAVSRFVGEFLRHTRKFLASNAFIAAYSTSSRDLGLPSIDSRRSRVLPAIDSRRVHPSEIDLDDNADPNHETHP